MIVLKVSSLGISDETGNDHYWSFKIPLNTTMTWLECDWNDEIQHHDRSHEKKCANNFNELVQVLLHHSVNLNSLGIILNTIPATSDNFKFCIITDDRILLNGKVVTACCRSDRETDKQKIMMEYFVYLWMLYRATDQSIAHVNIDPALDLIYDLCSCINPQNELFWQEDMFQCHNYQQLVHLEKIIFDLFPRIQNVARSVATTFFGHVCRAWVVAHSRINMHDFVELDYNPVQPFSKFLNSFGVSPFYFFDRDDLTAYCLQLLHSMNEKRLLTPTQMQELFASERTNLSFVPNLNEEYGILSKIFTLLLETCQIDKANKLFEYMSAPILNNEFKEEHFAIYLRFRVEVEYMACFSPPFISFYRAIDFLNSIANELDDHKSKLSNEIYSYLKFEIYCKKLKKSQGFEVEAAYYNKKEYLTATFKEELQLFCAENTQYFKSGVINHSTAYELIADDDLSSFQLLLNTTEYTKIAKYLKSIAAWYEERGNSIQCKAYLEKADYIVSQLMAEEKIICGYFELAELRCNYLDASKSMALLKNIEYVWKKLNQKTAIMYYPKQHRILVSLRARLTKNEKEKRKIYTELLPYLKQILRLEKENTDVLDDPDFNFIVKYGGNDTIEKTTEMYQYYVSMIKERANMLIKTEPKIALKIYRGLITDNIANHDHCSIRLYILSLFTTLNMQQEAFSLCDQLLDYYGTYSVVKIRCYQFLVDYYRRQMKYSTLHDEEINLLDKCLLHITGAIEVLKEDNSVKLSTLSDFLQCSQSASCLYAKSKERRYIVKSEKWKSLNTKFTEVFADLTQFISGFDFSNMYTLSILDLLLYLYSILNDTKDLLSIEQIKLLLNTSLILSEQLEEVCELFKDFDKAFQLFEVASLICAFIENYEEHTVPSIHYQSREIDGLIFLEEPMSFHTDNSSLKENQKSFVEFSYDFLRVMLKIATFAYNYVPYMARIYKKMFSLHRKNKTLPKSFFENQIALWTHAITNVNHIQLLVQGERNINLFKTTAKFSTTTDGIEIVKFPVIKDISSLQDSIKLEDLRQNDLFYQEEFSTCISLIQSYQKLFAINFRDEEFFQNIIESFTKLRAVRSMKHLEHVTGLSGLHDTFFSKIQPIEIDDNFSVFLGVGGDRVYIYATLDDIDLLELTTEDRTKLFEELLFKSFFGLMDPVRKLGFLSCGLNDAEDTIYLHTSYNLSCASFSTLLFTVQAFILAVEYWREISKDILSKPSKKNSNRSTNIRQRILSNTSCNSTSNTMKKYGLTKKQAILVNSIIDLIEHKKQVSPRPSVNQALSASENNTSPTTTTTTTTTTATNSTNDNNSSLLDTFTWSTHKVLSSYLEKSMDELIEGKLEKQAACDALLDSYYILCYMSDMYHIGQLDSTQKANLLLDRLGTFLGIAGGLQFSEDRLCAVATNSYSIFIQHQQYPSSSCQISAIDHIFVFSMCTVNILNIHKKDLVYTYLLKKSLLGKNCARGGIGIRRNSSNPEKVTICFYVPIRVASAKETALIDLLPEYLQEYNVLLEELEKMLADRSC
ncbi:hypothetical protein C9374_005579 [Naegleria lovaniensis]|uniref:Uncharacterized protein n=1 Tax=Naegleria lovaniensis TaxID=51637 RepID=A0AA88GQ04_NAELO|nr:uncharacterized protein C9374_005579 [Naegleria lovaniensis]KAG2382377.1 hypothetical protein C9374_005579 [Naegleria lovaniensis]